MAYVEFDDCDICLCSLDAGAEEGLRSLCPYCYQEMKKLLLDVSKTISDKKMIERIHAVLKHGKDWRK